MRSPATYFVDTAAVYRNEHIIGDVLCNYNHRSIFVTSKLGTRACLRGLLDLTSMPRPRDVVHKSTEGPWIPKHSRGVPAVTGGLEEDVPGRIPRPLASGGRPPERGCAERCCEEGDVVCYGGALQTGYVVVAHLAHVNFAFTLLKGK